ncbi:MAG: formylglycine-generating enzyme family protein, partial [Verrucomicrobiota bacterium]
PLNKDVVLPFRWIQPGTFLMGERGGQRFAEPVHEVEIIEGFWLGETPVTQEQYQALTGENPSHFHEGEEARRRPVEQVTWEQARAFSETLGERAGPGWHGDLPTEAQWEYACRAGSESKFWHGGDEDAFDEVGWHRGNSSRQTQPVARKLANPWGLYDMYGNVWEWCRDAWVDFAYRQRQDGVQAPFVDGGENAPRVVRGGTIWNYPVRCRSAFRSWGTPVDRNGNLGFRAELFRRPAFEAEENGAQAVAAAEPASDRPDSAGPGSDNFEGE